MPWGSPIVSTNATADVPGRARRLGAARPNWNAIFVVGFLLVLGLGLWILAPSFYRPTNLLNVARQSSFVGVIAIGQTFVILTGGIDLSVGACYAVVGVVSAQLALMGWPPEAILVTALLLGSAIGLVNGMGVALLKMPPFIMTLASMVAMEGVALYLANGGPIRFTTKGTVWDLVGSGDVAGIPGPVIIFLVVVAVGFLVLRYLAFGRYIYAIGGSLEAARLSGVRTNRTIVGAYMVSGMCAGLVGLMTAARLSTGDPNGGSLANLDSITAVVMGGTSLMGGVGGVIGTALGALMLGVLSNTMNLIGIDPFAQYVVKGIVIVGAVLFAARAAKGRLAERGVAQRAVAQRAAAEAAEREGGPTATP
jgi:ribose transport system permease protein